MFIKTWHTVHSIFFRILVYSLILAISIFSSSNSAKAHPCPGDKENQANIDKKIDIIRLLADKDHWNQAKIDKNIVYNRNDYGCHEDWEEKINGELKKVYPAGGGHAGWDIDFIHNDNHPFHSITRGTLVALGEGANNTIAIYDPINEKMVLYLHANRVNKRLDIGDWIDFKTYLGDQGDKGFSFGEHVHIEVRRLANKHRDLPFDEKMEKLTNAAWGRFDKDHPTIAPVPYLHNFAKWYLGEKKANACLIWAACKADL